MLSRFSRASPVVLPLLVLLCLGFSPRIGFAEPTLRTANPVSRARRLCDEARKLRQTGRFGPALAAYQQAYALVPTPIILIGEAEVYRDAERPGEGLAILAHVDADALPAARRHDLIQLRDELAAHVIRVARPLPMMGRPASDLRRIYWPGDDPFTTARLRPARAFGDRRLTVAKWLLGGVALLAGGIGAGLLAVDCDGVRGLTNCPSALHSRVAGIVTLSGGALALAGSAVLFYLDAQKEHVPSSDGALTLVARY